MRTVLSVRSNPQGGRRPCCALIVAVFLGLLVAWPTVVDAQIRVVTYNIAQRLGNDNALRDVLEHIMHDDKPGFDVPISVIVFQEARVQDVAVLQQLINDAAPEGVFYAQGTWQNLGEDCCAGGSVMFYRAGMLIEDSSAYEHMYTEAGRYTRRWRLRLLGYDSPDAAFYIYSSHLKASTGGANEQLRLQGVTTIRENADALPPETAIIYAGDMNFYHNNEPGYLKFIQPGPARAFDPLGTGPWSGPLQAIKHSQSPRLINAGGLVGGGMNQRFDFQLITEALQDGQGISIIDETYRSFGNDGQHYNDAINAGNNFYYQFNVPLSNLIADDLHDASDHIPVIAAYQLPAKMVVLGPSSDFGKVIQDANFDVTFTVLNDVSNVVTQLGADVLAYVAEGSGDFSGTVIDEVEAMGDESVGAVAVDTSTVGSVSGTITITTDNVAAQNPVIVRESSGLIIRASQPSFDAQSEISEEFIELELDPDTGVHVLDIDIHNLGYDEWQSLVSVDEISGLEAPFSYLGYASNGESGGGLPDSIGEEPATLQFAIDTDGLQDGLYESLVTVLTSDEDVPGQSTSMLNLHLALELGDIPVCLADVAGPDGEPDGLVDVFDLLMVISEWGTCPAEGDCPADITGPDGEPDGTVDVFDLLKIISEWGPCM